MPRVSVVIAAWNAAATIESTIRSALAQTIGDIEIVVVDDGSTDLTGDIVSSVGDERVTLLRQSNKGQSAALNLGVSSSRGEFIKFLDADDWINSLHLESQLDALAMHPTHLASCRWGYFRESPTVSLVREEHTNRDYDNPVDWIADSLTLDEGMMGGWMWLIPRPVWDASGGWNEALSLNNDFDFSIRLLLSSSGVRFANDAVYAYREIVDGALSATSGRKAMDSAALTTAEGCRALLSREDSPRTRRICADRWQRWEFVFYPSHPELAERARAQVERLGGSDLQIEGGRLLGILRPIIGWRGARRLQTFAYRSGWRSVLRWKTARRAARINAGLE